MRIAEIYRTRQGEGFLTGADSAFVRASGCNLRCRYCDTPYTSWRPEGDDLSVDEIVRQVETLGCDHVVVTGGEPMLFAELIPLCRELKRGGRHITIETAGTLYLPVACDLMSISPKLSNSTPTLKEAPHWRDRHNRTRHAPDVIARLVAEYAYQFKFVIARREDCDEVERYLIEFPDVERSRVMLMPEGTDGAALDRTAEWLAPLCREVGFAFCPRKHIEWFGHVRGA